MNHCCKWSAISQLLRSPCVFESPDKASIVKFPIIFVEFPGGFQSRGLGIQQPVKVFQPWNLPVRTGENARNNILCVTTSSMSQYELGLLACIWSSLPARTWSKMSDVTMAVMDFKLTLAGTPSLSCFTHCSVRVAMIFCWILRNLRLRPPASCRKMVP